MQWFVFLYIIINLLATVICTTIAILVPQRTAQADWGFRLFALMTALWCAASGLFFLNRSLNDFWIWTGIQLVPYVAIPVLWFYFILQFTGDSTPHPVFLFLVPAATLIIYWNPDWSWLMWSITKKDWWFGISIAQYERGFWFNFMHTPYSYALILLGHCYLLRAMWQSRRKKIQPLFILFLCGLIPLILNILTLSPLYDSLRFFDLTPIGLSISSVCFCWGLSHYQLLQRSPLAYQQIFASLKAAILVVDLHYRVIEFNAAAEVLLGCTQNSIGDSAKKLIEFLQASDWHQLIHEGQTEVLAIDRWFQLEQFPIRRQQKLLGYILNISDITKSRQLQEQVLQGALLYDALTGLPNRTLFADRLEQAIKYCHRDPNAAFAVAFIDLDRFKIINDSLGHAAGDRVLVEVAKRFQSCLRSEDTVARFAGDEFAFLLTNTHNIDIASLCERLQQKIKEPILLGTHNVATSASIGIAFGSARANAEQLVRNADIAMYQAKANGKGTFAVFDQAIGSQTIRTMELEVSLRHALEREEFFLVFQPIVAINSGKIQGFEALLRWQHPEYGLIVPSVFIPIAEEMGIISMLDGWVLQNACQQLRRWQQQYPMLNLTMSVNLSSANFMFSNLVETVIQVLEATQILGRHLKLEITESIVMKDPDGSAKVLEKLKEYGVGILLDDFGTGHSSLSYLHQLPFDGLKIDRSFVQEAQYNPQSLEIIKTIISLAKGLRLKIIAEGVETGFQRQMLQDLGCQLGQGYLWAKPLTKRDGDRFIADNVKAMML
ncbi:EAL domain-containing protein [Merismopedia glauca]|uniref:Response regulator receiver protein n=1 Tax=Merismopedia glauca CCAP 1448/3 TaxID=1296344 RepID=A0A2T1C7G5_9CYAN|nr:EAL domain-containing protein [Merismopedia glauca]PSB04222.1 response regulator receiver protein [Merismopedia glauca CCAP 1448/3]